MMTSDFFRAIVECIEIVELSAHDKAAADDWRILFDVERHEGLLAGGGNASYVDP